MKKGREPNQLILEEEQRGLSLTRNTLSCTRQMETVKKAASSESEHCSRLITLLKQNRRTVFDPFECHPACRPRNVKNKTAWEESGMKFHSLVRTSHSHFG